MTTNRYEKQIKLKEVGTEGQARLRKARVAIIGLGGLGGPCALSLAAAGVGHIFICDGDQVELSNLHRQVHFTEKDIGENKAFVVNEKLKNLNSEIIVDPYQENIRQDNIYNKLSGYDIILDCTDNLKSKFLLNSYCFKEKKVLVFASISKWLGQAAFFSYDSACLQCLFPHVQEGLFCDCNQSGILGPNVHIVASLQAQLALNWILFKNDPKLFYVVDTLSLRFSPVEMRKNAGCALCGNGKAKSYLQGLTPACFAEVPTSVLSYKDYLVLKKKNPKTVLVDIREQELFHEKSFPDAVNIPYRNIITGRLNKNDFDAESNYVIFCGNNLRAPVACGFLKELGLKRLFILSSPPSMQGMLEQEGTQQ